MDTWRYIIMYFFSTNNDPIIRPKNATAVFSPIHYIILYFLFCIFGQLAMNSMYNVSHGI